MAKKEAAPLSDLRWRCALTNGGVLARGWGLRATVKPDTLRHIGLNAARPAFPREPEPSKKLGACTANKSQVCPWLAVACP